MKLTLTIFYILLGMQLAFAPAYTGGRVRYVDHLERLKLRCNIPLNESLQTKKNQRKMDSVIKVIEKNYKIMRIRQKANHLKKFHKQ